MQDVWQKRGGEPHNEIHIVRKRQRRCLCSQGNRRKDFARLLDCLLARKRALADQNTDVVHPHYTECTSLCRGRNFVDLRDHAASWESPANYSRSHGVSTRILVLGPACQLRNLLGVPNLSSASPDEAWQIPPALTASTLSSASGSVLRSVRRPFFSTA